MTRRGADAGTTDPRRDRLAQLVTAAASGDRTALDQLLAEAQGVAYRFSVTVCGHADEAEDVMQDALLRTFRHVQRIEHPEYFRTWLYRTVRNACLMRRRRRVDEPAHLLSIDEPAPDGEDVPPVLEIPDPGRTPEQLAANTHLRGQLAAALQQLSPTLRLTVFLRDIEGLSTREVAQVMRVSEANVKTRLHRARQRLRAVLDGNSSGSETAE